MTIRELIDRLYAFYLTSDLEMDVSVYFTYNNGHAASLGNITGVHLDADGRELIISAEE